MVLNFITKPFFRSSNCMKISLTKCLNFDLNIEHAMESRIRAVQYFNGLKHATYNLIGKKNGKFFDVEFPDFGSTSTFDYFFILLANSNHFNINKNDLEPSITPKISRSSSKFPYRNHNTDSVLQRYKVID